MKRAGTNTSPYRRTTAPVVVAPTDCGSTHSQRRLDHDKNHHRRTRRARPRRCHRRPGVCAQARTAIVDREAVPAQGLLGPAAEERQLTPPSAMDFFDCGASRARSAATHGGDPSNRSTGPRPLSQRHANALSRNKKTRARNQRATDQGHIRSHGRSTAPDKGRPGSGQPQQ